MTAVLHLSQPFQCHSCGRCCRNSWDIRVEPQARPGISNSEAFHQIQRQGYQPLVVLADDSIATGRTPEGACLFLTAEQLCSIHGELGGGNKPLACQLYPYSVTATPTGYYASLSFACPSVVAGAGGDLEANRQELLGLLEERGAGAQELPHQVEIAEGRQVSWSSYQSLEVRLLEAFRPEDPVSSLLDLAVAMLENVEPWPDLRASERDDPFEESVLAMFAASVISLWELPQAPEQRQDYSQAVLSGSPVWSQRHGIALPPFDIGLVSEAWVVDVFARYFRNAVVGKALLAPTVVSRLLALAIGSALVLYYSEAFRQAQGEDAVSMETLSRSFELVEADLVTHTRSADPLFAAFESTLRQARGLEG